MEKSSSAATVSSVAACLPSHLLAVYCGAEGVLLGGRFCGGRFCGGRVSDGCVGCWKSVPEGLFVNEPCDPGTVDDPGWMLGDAGDVEDPWMVEDPELVEPCGLVPFDASGVVAAPRSLPVAEPLAPTPLGACTLKC